MGKKKQMCEVAPGVGMTISQSNEHLRNARNAAAQKRWKGNYDPTREHLNFEVTKGGIIAPVDKKFSIPRRIKGILKERNIIDPNIKKKEEGKTPNIRTVANFVLGGSREQMHRLAFGDQAVNLNRGADNSLITRNKAIENWAIDTYNFMAQKYGEENIAAFVVHMDEINPHVHCTILPITKDNKISWKKVMVGKDKYEYRDRMLKLHDEFAEVNKKYDLERGDAIAVTGAKHRTTEQYHQWLDEQKEKLEKDIYQQKREMSDLDAQIAVASKRVKGLSTMFSNLEVQRQRIEGEISVLQAKAEEGQLSSGELQLQEQLTNELEAIKSKIEERKNQLQDAKSKLEVINSRKKSLEDGFKQFSEEYNDIEKGVKEWMKSQMFHKVAQEISRTYSDVEDCLGKFDNHFSTEQKEYAHNKWADNEGPEDKISLEEIADFSNEIVAVSAALFMGYVDGAVNFAHANGGGGSSPGSGWGRGKDDDDDMWRRKCLFMGMKMMRPAGKQSRRNAPRQQTKGIRR
jgi:predicted  nucleic acid-binding Zn-ribbon protein